MIERSLRLKLLLVTAAGLLGFAAFLVITPRFHPDAAVNSITADEALAEALRIVPALESLDSGTEREVVVKRTDKLLANLQEELGLRSFAASFKTGELDPLPVYFHEVRWMEEREDREGHRQVAVVRLLPSGGLVHMDVSQVEGRSGDTDALRAGGYGGEIPLSERIYFQPSHGMPALDGDMPRVRVDAEAMARYHIERSAFARLPLRLDSIAILQDDRQSVARVKFAADTLVSDRTVKLDVEVRSDGALEKLSIREMRRPDAPETSGDHTITAGGRSDAAGIVVVAVHILLFVLILGLFFRRVSARMVDYKFALRDGLWAAAWLMVAVAATAGYQVLGSVGVTPLGMLIASLLVIATGAAATFIVFVVAAVGDSYQRAESSETLRSLDLVRRFRFVNRPVGFSLIAGVSVAGVVLGLQSLGMALPGAAIQLGEDLTHSNSVRPFVSALGASMWMASYVVFALIAVPAGFFGMRKAWVAAVVSIGLLTLTDVSPISFEPIWLAISLSAVTGAVLYLTSRVFDLVATAVALMLATAIDSTSTGWLVPNALPIVDIAVVALVVIGVVATGVVGLIRGDGEEARESFVPDYVREIGRQQRMERELEIARSVQQSLLPRRLPSVEGLDVATMCVPATEVGGDYFDFIRIDEDRIGVIIGDVSGKGIQAAFYMTLVKGIVQTLATTESDPHCVLSRLNEHFYANAPRGTFISVVYGVIDLRERTFCFARAGHNPVLVRRASRAEFSQPRGMAIGLLPGERFGSSLESHCVDLAPGDVVLLYTDVITEAMDASRNLFGEERLASAVNDSSADSAAELLTDITIAVSRFTQGAEQSDDMTAVLIRFREAVSPHQSAGSSTFETITLQT
jgi:phosphoserine phosphatase RsbU/P